MIPCICFVCFCKYVNTFSCIFIYVHVFACMFTYLFLYFDVFSYIFVWNPIALAWQSGKPNILRQGPAHVWCRQFSLIWFGWFGWFSSVQPVLIETGPVRPVQFVMLQFDAWVGVWVVQFGLLARVNGDANSNNLRFVFMGPYFNHFLSV